MSVWKQKVGVLGRGNANFQEEQTCEISAIVETENYSGPRLIQIWFLQLIPLNSFGLCRFFRIEIQKFLYEP